MEARKENKMGIQPVGKLLVSMSLPVMVSMLIQALYNIVDSVFVSRISENALTAVSLAFPIQNLIIAVAVGTGVGINSLLSRRLGERNFEDANAAAENGIMLAVLSWIVFAIVGGLFSDDFFRMFTSNPEIVEMGTQYLSVCCVFSFGCFLQLATERIMQATGVTIFNMITQGIGAITNIILDPILIFGLLGMPKMGVKGAAVATVAGQILAMALGLLFNHLFNHEVRMNFLKFRPNWRIVREIYKVGVPSIVMQSIATLMTGGMNKIRNHAGRNDCVYCFPGADDRHVRFLGGVIGRDGGNRCSRSQADQLKLSWRGSWNCVVICLSGGWKRDVQLDYVPDTSIGHTAAGRLGDGALCEPGRGLAGVPDCGDGFALSGACDVPENLSQADQHAQDDALKEDG